jgi:hypothetical protein
VQSRLLSSSSDVNHTSEGDDSMKFHFKEQLDEAAIAVQTDVEL